ncbi:MAG: hypothetical protein K9G62_06605 [Alphaproteobacteria bacterium]|nr:hypothetical protein [Alphaproteobacteria bacterium]
MHKGTPQERLFELEHSYNVLKHAFADDPAMKKSARTERVAVLMEIFTLQQDMLNNATQESFRKSL